MPPPRRPYRRLFAHASTAFLLATGVVVLPPSAPQAGASSVYICTGYQTCADAGYGHAGYASRNKHMFWRMYSGHNCTNYVAYRMIQRGMSTERPWDGSGMAYNWGFARADITDDTPAVGAVAWWNRGVSGAGSSGHVAYVEKVVSPTQIVISEDSWSGDFHWRTIYKDGSGWPTGFIHFVDQKSVSVKTPPVVTGSPQVGVPLSAGVARFAPGAKHALQWYADGVAIPGATSTTYTPSPGAVGAALTVSDTATRRGYVGTRVVSAPTAPVVPGLLARVARPAVTGLPEVGEVLTAVPGQWSPAPESVTFRWKVDGVWLQDRNGPTFTLTPAEVGKTVTLVEVARRAGYEKMFGAASDLGPVVQGVVEQVTPFAASGTARHGSTLSFATGTWTPSDATVIYEWMRDGVVVPGASAATYVLGDADVGRTITARATVSKPRFQSLVRSADFGVVTTPSTLTVKAGGRRRGAVAVVRVAAPGVATPDGVVTATIGKHVVRGRLVDGAVTLTFTSLGKGVRTVRIAYEGSGAVEASRASAKVTIKP